MGPAARLPLRFLRTRCCRQSALTMLFTALPGLVMCSCSQGKPTFMHGQKQGQQSDKQTCVRAHAECVWLAVLVSGAYKDGSTALVLKSGTA